RIAEQARRPLLSRKLDERKRKWSAVLEKLHTKTKKPLIVHVNSGMTSEEVVSNPQFLSAITVQTGHSRLSQDLLWKLPLKSNQEEGDLGKPFINLEPWYEGIRDDFYLEDQLFAYWVSMLAGAASFCYGAHGVWNAGDGEFLSHWGKQTLQEALSLSTPSLIGKSHHLYTDLRTKLALDESFVEVQDGKLVQIYRKNS